MAEQAKIDVKSWAGCTAATLLAIGSIAYFNQEGAALERPQPSYGYVAGQLPDSEYIEVATLVVNLIATYQTEGARGQFEAALKHLAEPSTSAFRELMLGNELRAIEETKRSQMFYINPRSIKVERFPELNMVVVRIPGLRQKQIGNKPLPADEMVYYVKMTTIPPNVNDKSGIVVTDLRLRRADERQVSREDAIQNRAERRAERGALRGGAK